MLFNIKTKQSLITAAFTLLVALPLGSAMAASQGERPERPMGPPPEAFTACENLSADDACSMTTPRGDMEGTCKGAPNGEEGPLACAPAGGKRGGRPPRSDSETN